MKEQAITKIRFFQFILSLLMLMTPVIGMTQVDTIYTLERSIKVEAKYFTTDKLQQSYIVTPKNEVIKYSPLGKELFRFNNNALGDLVHIDVTDPFNILLYYPSFLTVVTLDRTMNKTSEFNLYDLDVMQVEAIAMANDNRVWIYDDVNFAMKKINAGGETITESDNLSALLGIALAPNFILERDNKLYVNDPAEGIIIFDNFGQYDKTLPIKHLENFQVFEDQLIYKTKSGIVNLYHMRSLFTSPLTLPLGVEGTYKIQIQKNRLYVLQEDFLNIYSF